MGFKQGHQERKGQIVVSANDVVLVPVDTIRDAGAVRIVAFVHEAGEDIEPPNGVRDHIHDSQHGCVKDTRRAGKDERLERCLHLLDERDEPQCAEHLKRPREPTEPTDEDEARCDVDDYACHDGEIEHIPDTTDVRVRGEEEAAGDDIDDELDGEHEP